MEKEYSKTDVSDCSPSSVMPFKEVIYIFSLPFDFAATW